VIFQEARDLYKLYWCEISLYFFNADVGLNWVLIEPPFGPCGRPTLVKLGQRLTAS